MRLYLDASAIIYSIEAASPFREGVLDRMSRAVGSATGNILTSRLSRLECRVKPLREGRADLLAIYDAFLAPGSVDLIDLSPTVIEIATDLRVRYKFKTPDAIHLATAITGRADSFLTGDKELSRCREVAVDVL